MHVNKTKFEETVLKSIITWPVLGKQNIQAKEVHCSHLPFSLIHPFSTEKGNKARCKHLSIINAQSPALPIHWLLLVLVSKTPQPAVS